MQSSNELFIPARPPVYYKPFLSRCESLEINFLPIEHTP